MGTPTKAAGGEAGMVWGRVSEAAVVTHLDARLRAGRRPMSYVVARGADWDCLLVQRARIFGPIEAYKVWDLRPCKGQDHGRGLAKTTDCIDFVLSLVEIAENIIICEAEGNPMDYTLPGIIRSKSVQ